MALSSLTASSNLIQTLYQAALDEKDTDFKLIAGNRSVPCHKVILCAQCEFFEEIVNTGVSQYDFGEDSVMAEDDGNVLALTLRFVYLGTIPLTDENVEWYVSASDVIEYPKIKNYCERYLLENLNINNCRNYQEIAERHQLRNLKNKCLQMANGELE